MNLFLLLLSAFFAAALMPLTAKVAARSVVGPPLVVPPLAILIAGVLGWSLSEVAVVGVAAVFAVATASAVLAAQLVIDLCVRRLLRELSYSGLALFLIAIVFVDPLKASGFKGALFGALAMTAITAVLVLSSRGALGLGDLHISPFLGAIIGWFAPSAVLLAWMIAAFSGALFTVTALLSKRVQRNTMIPYGPFLILGSLLAVLISSVN